jgi:hypothetical protein
MQSASPDMRTGLMLMPGRLVGRTRVALGGGVAWSIVIVLLLTLAVARSTATEGWVIGIDVVGLVALGGAVLMAVLAVLPVPWSAGLTVGALAGAIVSLVAAQPTLHALHPADPAGLGLVRVWLDRIASGEAAGDSGFFLLLICLLMWVTGGWLSWCVLRWRKPMLGLVPAAAAFSTNLLNAVVPGEQNGYTLVILVLTLALLLWTNYTTSIANATRARVKLTGDARWDFWESGLVAMAALIVLGIMLPPISTVDRTVDLQASIFTQWALLQDRLNHTGPFASGNGTANGTTGFSGEVKLGGSLTRSTDPVFSYTGGVGYGAPRYFRGLNLIETQGQEWRYQSIIGIQDSLSKNTVPLYAEDYLKLANAQFTIKMFSPPVGYNSILFYPGELYKVDRNAAVSQSVAPFVVTGLAGQLDTIDRLSSVSPPSSAGRYVVSVEYSTATEADLRAAGTGYPDWVNAYIGLPTLGYRDSQVLDQIQQLALSITAGASNPYDKAVAIQTYLRSTAFKYSLTTSIPVGDTDRLWYFLNTSKTGYCEYFATAMGDMLRLLGIPTRLVNGYGPGNYDNKTFETVVRADDAHTWVEAYFPNYGWIPFEPTADTNGVYQPVQRGSTAVNPCVSDRQCSGSGTSGAGPGDGSGGRVAGGQIAGGPKGGGPAGIAFRVPDAGTLTTIAGILLALLLIALAAAARYLRPRTVMKVWKRTLVLARLAGADRRAGETPLELGRRLTRNFPEATQPIRALADGFVVSAYAPAEVAETARPAVMEAWTALRPMLLRRLFRRLRPGRP